MNKQKFAFNAFYCEISINIIENKKIDAKWKTNKYNVTQNNSVFFNGWGLKAQIWEKLSKSREFYKLRKKWWLFG